MHLCPRPWVEENDSGGLQSELQLLAAVVLHLPEWLRKDSACV